MKVILAEHYGLCFGVEDALEQARKLAQQAPLTILGELVHNPLVREELSRIGAVQGQIDDLQSASTRQVMVTAHGASDAAQAAWRGAGFGVADGTCPLVKHAHARLRSLVELGYHPVVIGQKGHAEVMGLIGDFPDATVIAQESDFGNLPVRTRYGVISQTTQPIEKARALVENLRAARHESEVRFCDTVCKPTKDRQRALRELLERVDVLIVVGGRNSNNTRQLVEASLAAGIVAHHIERPAELDVRWFRANETVGLTAGTSTLRETVGAVHARLLAIAADFVCKGGSEI